MAGLIGKDTLRGGIARKLVWGAAALLMLLPAVAMQFTEEMNWTAGDFMVWGVMLLSACAGFEVAARVARSNAYLAAAGVALAGGFLVTWVNLAVGIIGNENDPANQMFFWVLAVGLIGAVVVLLRARPMVWVMTAVAVAQLAAGVYAWLAGLGHVFVFTGVMCAVWIASARLFHLAAKAAAASPTHRT